MRGLGNSSSLIKPGFLNGRHDVQLVGVIHNTEQVHEGQARKMS